LSESQRIDLHARGDSDTATEIDRDAKIEQLLLVGLDHYFATHYEQAINVWTRALFLDRNHARARAYIERARGALAERQRQSEEWLHSGVAAFQRGDGVEARRLLEAAIAGGAPPEEALPVLERLNRPAPDASASVDAPDSGRRLSALRKESTRSSIFGGRGAAVLWTLVLALLTLAAYLTVANRADWPLPRPFKSAPEAEAGAAAAPIAQDLSLPLPRRGEMMLARGRMLAANGRLYDALAALDQVRPTDPQKEEADRLRGDIQRQLLALTPMPPPVPNAAGRTP
jgi:tetratricopeptide (TPR) repeat protein